MYFYILFYLIFKTANHHIVVDIAEEIAKQKVPKVSKVSGPKRKEYDKLDEVLLPKVKKIVDEIIEQAGSGQWQN